MTSDISFTYEKLSTGSTGAGGRGGRRYKNLITRWFDASCFIHDLRFDPLKTAAEPSTGRHGRISGVRSLPPAFLKPKWSVAHQSGVTNQTFQKFKSQWNKKINAALKRVLVFSH